MRGKDEKESHRLIFERYKFIIKQINTLKTQSQFEHAVTIINQFQKEYSIIIDEGLFWSLKAEIVYNEEVNSCVRTMREVLKTRILTIRECIYPKITSLHVRSFQG